MSDQQQQRELIMQTNRCICYMEFINTHYPSQVHPSALTDDMLKELVVSSLFVEVESLDRVFYQFDESEYISELAKYYIAYNTKNQCGKDYVPGNF